MTPFSDKNGYLNAVVTTMTKRPWLWAAPLLVCTITMGMYAFLAQRPWKAVQSFVVRDEMIGQTYQPGRFDSLDSMKTAQETITEVARNSKVIQRTLNQLGENPSVQDIESVQGAISFAAPNGAEFGKTEILLMTVKSKSAAHAKKLVTALFDELEKELRTLRKQRGESMVRELELAAESTKTQLDYVAAKLKKMETSVGSNLVDLRALNETNSAPGTLTSELSGIRNELRPARIELDSLVRQQNSLNEVLNNSEEILATPSELLELQPALSQLKTGLIEAQLNLAQVNGQYGDQHPKTQAAANAVDDIKKRIDLELVAIIKGLSTQRQLAENKIANLEQREKEASKKLDTLAGLRVDYGKLNDEYQQRRENYGSAIARLEQAQSIVKAADEVDLIQKTDDAFVGSRPTGPRKSSMILVGLVSGFVFGLGCVLFLTPYPDSGPDSTSSLDRAPTPPSGSTPPQHMNPEPGPASQPTTPAPSYSPPSPTPSPPPIPSPPQPATSSLNQTAPAAVEPTTATPAVAAPSAVTGATPTAAAPIVSSDVTPVVPTVDKPENNEVTPVTSSAVTQEAVVKTPVIEKPAIQNETIDKGKKELELKQVQNKPEPKAASQSANKAKEATTLPRPDVTASAPKPVSQNPSKQIATEKEKDKADADKPSPVVAQKTRTTFLKEHKEVPKKTPSTAELPEFPEKDTPEKSEVLKSVSTDIIENKNQPAKEDQAEIDRLLARAIVQSEKTANQPETDAAVEAKSAKSVSEQSQKPAKIETNPKSQPKSNVPKFEVSISPQVEQTLEQQKSGIPKENPAPAKETSKENADIDCTEQISSELLDQLKAQAEIVLKQQEKKKSEETKEKSESMIPNPDSKEKNSGSGPPFVLPELPEGFHGNPENQT